MRFLSLVFLSLILLSCKAKQIVASTQAEGAVNTQVLLNTHEALNKDFKTLSINANTSYKDNKNSYSFTTDIRIEKDQKILISAKFLGFVVAKALITPTQVQYYEKNNGTYFEGDFSQLSKWLGTPLSFDKVQNLLLGKMINEVNQKEASSKIENGLNVVTIDNEAFNEYYAFESLNALLKSQQIFQKNERRTLQSIVESHQRANNLFLPAKYFIEAKQENNSNSVNIEIDYKSIKINEPLSFPYSVPQGYTQAQLD
jgi:hypothetical protein